MNKIFQGTIHGKTIKLDEDPGVSEGQLVEIQMKIIPSANSWGDGIHRSAGGWADHPEIAGVMEKIQRERKLERQPSTDGE